MTRSQIASGLFAFSLAACSAAHAQAPRTWVSGVGDDTNPCSRTAPCKTFAGALAKTAAGGEVDALDPGDFGTVTINKAITINGGGGQIASVQASGTTGVLIQAGAADTVTLRNIDIIGTGLTGDGVQITSGGSIHLQNTRISSFEGNGININASAAIRVFVDESSATANGINGLTATATGGQAVIAISRSHFESNGQNGIYAASGSKFGVSDTTSSGNGAAGFLDDATSSVSSLNLTRCDATGNIGAGFAATHSGVVRVANSSVQLNGAAITNATGGNTVSFGNNSTVGTGVFSLTTVLR